MSPHFACKQPILMGEVWLWALALNCAGAQGPADHLWVQIRPPNKVGCENSQATTALSSLTGSRAFQYQRAQHQAPDGRRFWTHHGSISYFMAYIPDFSFQNPGYRSVFPFMLVPASEKPRQQMACEVESLLLKTSGMSSSAAWPPWIDGRSEWS